MSVNDLIKCHKTVLKLILNVSRAEYQNKLVANQQ